MRKLELGTNWRIIHEPPLIALGIWTTEIDGYQIQFNTERIPMGRLMKHRSNKNIKSKIIKLGIIGVTWKRIGKCKSVGVVITHIAFHCYMPSYDRRSLSKIGITTHG